MTCQMRQWQIGFHRLDGVPSALLSSLFSGAGERLCWRMAVPEPQPGGVNMEQTKKALSLRIRAFIFNTLTKSL